MLSTKLISQWVSKYLCGTAALGSGPVRAMLPVISPSSKVSLPSGGRAQARNTLPWGPVSATARILREFRLLVLINTHHHTYEDRVISSVTELFCPVMCLKSCVRSPPTHVDIYMHTFV